MLDFAKICQDAGRDYYKLYAVTFSPKSEYQEEHLYAQWLAQALGIKSGLKGCYYYIVPEMFQSGALHWHGTICVFDQMGFHKKLHLLRRRGFIKLKPITDLPEWEKYVMKDFEDVRMLFDFDPIMYHDSTITRDRRKKLGIIGAQDDVESDYDI